MVREGEQLAGRVASESRSEWAAKLGRRFRRLSHSGWRSEVPSSRRGRDGRWMIWSQLHRHCDMCCRRCGDAGVGRVAVEAHDGLGDGRWSVREARQRAVVGGGCALLGKQRVALFYWPPYAVFSTTARVCASVPPSS